MKIDDGLGYSAEVTTTATNTTTKPSWYESMALGLAQSLSEALKIGITSTAETYKASSLQDLELRKAEALARYNEAVAKAEADGVRANNESIQAQADLKALDNQKILFYALAVGGVALLGTGIFFVVKRFVKR